MREILFRGKCLRNDEQWVYGYYNGAINNEDGYFDVDLNTIGEYIGLCDKNGNKIFEGDVVEEKHTFSNGSTTVKTHIVEWRNESCGFEPFSDSKYDWDCYAVDPDFVEVIGNIYDNPELMGKK